MKFVTYSLIIAKVAVRSGAWQFASQKGGTTSRLPSAPTRAMASDIGCLDRRQMFTKLATLGIVIGIPTQPSWASDTAEVETTVPLKEFTDPLFSIRVPKNYFTLRRSAKGDLPDQNTGQGRKGATIFTAGDLQKAEVVAVERFPVRLLLEENGIDASGKLDTFPAIGEAQAIANLLNRRRERDRPDGGSNTVIVPGSLMLTSDGKDLMFQLKTEIDVQKPELLMETYGVSRLFRITVAKASLRSNDGYLVAAFGSALETDFLGPDGRSITEAVNSLNAIDQSVGAS